MKHGFKNYIELKFKKIKNIKTQYILKLLKNMTSLKDYDIVQDY